MEFPWQFGNRFTEVTHQLTGSRAEAGCLLAFCHTGKVLGDRLRVLDELQVYASTLEVGATVHRIDCIDECDIR